MKRFPVLFILLVIATMSRGQTVPASIFTTLAGASDTSILPLQHLTVTEKDKKALLRWESDVPPAAESFYAVERSNNGIDFNLVGITKSTGKGWIEFLDDSPPKGKIFYRVKLSTGQVSSYSETVAANPSAMASCKFYPNPADKVIIVRSDLGVELQISDRSGRPLITDKFPGGLKVIDVSSLEPGIYVITLFQKETGSKLTDKLIKK